MYVGPFEIYYKYSPPLITNQPCKPNTDNQPTNRQTDGQTDIQTTSMSNKIHFK